MTRPDARESPSGAEAPDPDDSEPTPGVPEAEGTGELAVRQEPAQSKNDEGYRVQLPMFEGPLDLLLHLVRKHELDILDIPIAFITEKYTAYLRLMDQMNIDVASEYLVMAATLVHIKSRSLLPNPPAEEAEDAIDDAELDPRAELVRRLLEYQKYKSVAQELGERSILGRDVFPRGVTEEMVAGPAPLSGVSMFKLLDAFQSVLERTQQTREHQIDFERFSISEKISEISDRLRNTPKLKFHEIFGTDGTRAELIITFLAILEMTKLRMTRLTQEGPLETIYIELRIADTGDDDDGDETTSEAVESDAEASEEPRASDHHGEYE